MKNWDSIRLRSIIVIGYLESAYVFITPVLDSSVWVGQRSFRARDKLHAANQRRRQTKSPGVLCLIKSRVTRLAGCSSDQAISLVRRWTWLSCASPPFWPISPFRCTPQCHAGCVSCIQWFDLMLGKKDILETRKVRLLILLLKEVTTVLFWWVIKNTKDFS